MEPDGAERDAAEVLRVWSALQPRLWDSQGGRVTTHYVDCKRQIAERLPPVGMALPPGGTRLAGYASGTAYPAASRSTDPRAWLASPRFSPFRRLKRNVCTKCYDELWISHITILRRNHHGRP